MASLTPGMLIKLLQGIDSDVKVLGPHRSVLLQVTTILPALTGEDDHLHLQAFFLKVSDSSHATYVSLSHHDTHLILDNTLKLGQFFYVDRLQAATPLPVLVGLRPLPRTHPLQGTPKDLMHILDPSSKGPLKTNNQRPRPGIKQKWNLIQHHTSVASFAHERLTPLHMAPKAELPPKSFTLATTTTKQRNLNCLSKVKDHDVPAHQHSHHPAAFCYLPSSLVNPGKGMVRRRNLALLVASQAQMEAQAAALLLHCIRIFADLCSSACNQNPQICLDKFFALDKLLHQSSIKDDQKAAMTTKTKSPESSPELSRSERVEWAQGDGLKEAKELRDTLLRETSIWFLKFMEGALDSSTTHHKKKGRNRKVEQEGMGVTLSHLKQSSEWLDKVNALEEDGDRVDSLKKKVYACLLLHVDSPALHTSV